MLIHIVPKLSNDMGPKIIHLLQMWKLRHRDASLRPPFNAYPGQDFKATIYTLSTGDGLVSGTIDFL